MPFSVFIVSNTQKGVDAVTKLLDPNIYYPVAAAFSGGEARRALLSCSYDAVIINTPLSDEFGHDLALHVADKSASGVILITKSELFDEISSQVENYGVLTVSKPLSRQLFHQAVKMIVAVRGRLRQFENEKQKLLAKNEELRIVAHAKCVLVEYLKMSEAQAHRYIEKQAMDMRTTKKIIAESILKTYEN